MLDYHDEQKLRRLLELIPDQEPEQKGGTSATTQKRDAFGQFAPETTKSKSGSVSWIRTGPNTYTRQEWPVWSDVLIIVIVIGIAVLVF